jgi:hypothetical protein
VVDDEKAAIFASLVVLLVASSLDGYFVIPTSQLAATVVLACAARAFCHSTEVVGEQRVLSAFSALMIAIAISTIAMLPFKSFGAPEVRETLWRADHRSEALWPRFWQFGWIGDDDPTSKHR